LFDPSSPGATQKSPRLVLQREPGSKRAPCCHLATHTKTKFRGLGLSKSRPPELIRGDLKTGQSPGAGFRRCTSRRGYPIHRTANSERFAPGKTPKESSLLIGTGDQRA